MKYYLKVYKALLRLNLARLMIYRTNFYNMLISSLGYSFLSFFSIIFLTHNNPVLFGWKREELILVMAFYNITIGGLFHMIFSHNFHFFSETIHYGRLDSVLLKPLDSQFLLSLSRIAFVQVFRILIGIGVSIYIITTYHMTVTWFGILGFIIFSFFGLIILYSIWFIVMTLTVWNSRLSNLVDLLYHLNDFARFPPEMYRFAKNYLFFVIPYTLIVIAPTKAILAKLSYLEMLATVFFTVFLFYFARKFWHHALKSYTSASS